MPEAVAVAALSLLGTLLGSLGEDCQLEADQFPIRTAGTKSAGAQ